MKKIIFALMAAAFVALPSFVSAGYVAGGGNVVINTRLEASADNSTWVNYLAEENSGGQTLTVSPGDTIYLRLKTWNTGGMPAGVEYTGTFTNPAYLDSPEMFSSGAGAKDDLDGDATYYYALTSFDTSSGVTLFTLDAIMNGSTVDANYQSGGITAQIKSDTPDQTEMLVTVQVTGADAYITWWQRLFTHAYADDAATTQVRILVSNPPATAVTTPTLPVTGPDPIQLIMSPVMRLCQ